MAHPQNSPRGLFTKRVITVTSTTGILFTKYSSTNPLIRANTSGVSFYAAGLALGDGVGKCQITANTTAFTLPGALKVSGKNLTVTANTTTITLSGKLAVSGKALTVEANTTTITLSGKLAVSGATPTISANSTGHTVSGTLGITTNANGVITGDTNGLSVAGNLRVSGKTPALTANTTGHILSGKVYLSGITTRNLGANSTCFLLSTVTALPNTRQLGGITFVSNSTGKMLAFHSTGTTWVYASKTSVLA